MATVNDKIKNVLTLYTAKLKTLLSNKRDVRRAGAGISAQTTTKPWKNYASIIVKEANIDHTISFKVHRTSLGEAGEIGILTVHFRVDSNKAFANGQLIWETAGNDICLSDFKMCYKVTSGTQTEVRLYVKCSSWWQGFVFEVLSETKQTTSGNYWNLYKVFGNDTGLENLPAGFSIISSARQKISRQFIFIGDSWGTGMGLSDKTKRYQQIVKDRLLKYDPNSKILLSAKDGAGFAVSGNSFLNQLNTCYDTIIANSSDIKDPDCVTDIIILGGLNDKDTGKDTIKTAIGTFNTIARQKFPNAKIQIGCLGRSAVYSQCYQLFINSYSAYSEKAAEDAVCYIKGSEYCMHHNGNLQSDGYHPNNDGHYMIANFLFNYLITGDSSVCYGLTPYSAKLWCLWGGNVENRPVVDMDKCHTMQQDGTITLNLSRFIVLTKDNGQLNSDLKLLPNQWYSIMNGDSKNCGFMNGCEPNEEFTCTTVSMLIAYDNGSSWEWKETILRLESNVENSEIIWKVRIVGGGSREYNNITQIWITPFTLSLPWYMC